MADADPKPESHGSTSGPKQILETPRLVLREMAPDDLDFVAEMLADPEVMRYYPKCYSRTESEQWLLRQLHRYARRGYGLWLVVERATGQPVGQVGPLLQEIDRVMETEVAYLIHRPFWRRGYATEAAAACRDWVFSTLARQQVFALIRPENEVSHYVARKLGMRFDGHVVEHRGLVHQVYHVSQSEISLRS